MRGLSALIVFQLIVTLALLGFAIVQEDPATRSLIIGAVIGNWFKEGTHLGQQLSEVRVSKAQQQSETP